MLEDLAGIVVQAHPGADPVDRSASEVEEGRDRGWEGSSDLVGRNNREEVVRKACPEILDRAQSLLVEGHSRDHIEDSSFETGAVADVGGVVGNSTVQMVADCDVAVLEVMAGSVEMRSVCI